MSFKNRTVLITGASRGIGKAIVHALADAGAMTAFTYRTSSSAAEEIVSDLASRGQKARAYQSDATSFQSATEVVESVVKEWGKLDILVNNAGITKDTLLVRMSEEDWDTVISREFGRIACSVV